MFISYILMSVQTTYTGKYSIITNGSQLNVGWDTRIWCTFSPFKP